ncbi:AraC family transcriptional regulator, partial [bacterium]|nr:AraC family transcriptional regulator [bacterium]
MKPIQITASSDLLTVLLGYAKKIGVDQEKVFAECGLTLDEIVSKTQRIPISVFNKIWNRVLSHSNDADFGLHFGETANEVLKRHLLYSMMMNCSTIKQAIHKNFQYHNLILDVISPKMVEKGEYVHLYWESMQDFIVEHRHFSESIIVMFMQMLRYLTDNQIKLKSVVFKHQKPENINEHVRLFGIVPEFKNEKNEVTFHRDILDHPLMFSNTQFLQDLEAMAQKAIHTIYLSGSWSDRVVRLIFQ